MYSILVKLAYDKDEDRHYNHANLPVCDKFKKLYYKHMVWYPLFLKPKNIQNSKKLAKQMRKEGANFQHHQQRRHCFGQTEQAHIGILFEKWWRYKSEPLS